MIVVNNAAVGAYRNINSGFLEILVTLLCNLYNCGSLTSADTLLLTRNAD